MRVLRSLSLGALALAGLPARAGAQAVGSEFQINTYTTSCQETGSDHLVAADASGNFVVVWTSDTQDGDDLGVFGQRYDSEGVARGDEFRVNSYTTGDQGNAGPGAPGGAAVASDASGSFVVVWRSDPWADSQDAIVGQRYDGMGGAIGSEFHVNTSTLNRQEDPSVAMDAAGNFVVVWDCDDGYQKCGVFGQRFDNAGIPQGGEFLVNPGGVTHGANPSIASDESGSFVVVWGYATYDYDEIFGQRFDNEGEPQGNRFRVNSYTTLFAGAPSVASDASGNFVVVWQSLTQDGDGWGVFGQRYESGGGAQGAEFRVNSYTTADQRNPSVASDASGNFVVVWDSATQDGDDRGVFGQRYDSRGVPQGGEFQINSYTTGPQAKPSAAAMGTNEFVVAWQSPGSVPPCSGGPGQDGSGPGVFGQRFDFGADAITVVSPNTNVKWRVGLLEKIQWTHNLGHRATFRIDVDRDDDGTFEELITAAAPSDSTRGSFAWTVTGPPSGTARVRVSWTDDLSVSDSSDVTFQIRPVGLD